MSETVCALYDTVLAAGGCARTLSQAGFQVACAVCEGGPWAAIGSDIELTLSCTAQTGRQELHISIDISRIRMIAMQLS